MPEFSNFQFPRRGAWRLRFQPGEYAKDIDNIVCIPARQGKALSGRLFRGPAENLPRTRCRSLCEIAATLSHKFRALVLASAQMFQVDGKNETGVVRSHQCRFPPRAKAKGGTRWLYP